MTSKEIELLKQEHKELKEKLKITKSLSKSYEIERRMIEINNILSEKLKTHLWRY